MAGFPKWIDLKDLNEHLASKVEGVDTERAHLQEDDISRVFAHVTERRSLFVLWVEWVRSSMWSLSAAGFTNLPADMYEF